MCMIAEFTTLAVIRGGAKGQSFLRVPLTQLLRSMGCVEMDSCKIPLTTDRNATFPKNTGLSNTFFICSQNVFYAIFF